MRIVIVGSGFVGATAGYALVMSGVGRELVLVDKNTARAEAEAADIRHAVPFAHALDVRAGGYGDLRLLRVVVAPASARSRARHARPAARNAVFAEVIRRSSATLLVRSRHRQQPGG